MGGKRRAPSGALRESHHHHFEKDGQCRCGMAWSELRIANLEERVRRLEEAHPYALPLSELEGALCPHLPSWAKGIGLQVAHEWDGGKEYLVAWVLVSRSTIPTAEQIVGLRQAFHEMAAELREPRSLTIRLCSKPPAGVVCRPRPGGSKSSAHTQN